MRGYVLSDGGGTIEVELCLGPDALDFISHMFHLFIGKCSARVIVSGPIGTVSAPAAVVGCDCVGVSVKQGTFGWLQCPGAGCLQQQHLYAQRQVVYY